MNHDLTADQQQQMLGQQLDSLRAERFAHQLNVARWGAIPEGLQDGSEQDGIDAAKHAIAVLEAQIDALEAMLPAKNRAARRAEGKRR